MTAPEQSEMLPQPVNPIVHPGFPTLPKPIAEFVERPDYPQCVVGERVDIGGVDGVAVGIVRNSLKVKSADNVMMSFNFHKLRELYGPRVEVIAPPVDEAAAEPKRVVITEPNFAVPVKPIQDFIRRPDYPACTLGEYVDVGGYQGVVVEIVKQSLKVRSVEETTRSYNAEFLRKRGNP